MWEQSCICPRCGKEFQNEFDMEGHEIEHEILDGVSTLSPPKKKGRTQSTESNKENDVENSPPPSHICCICGEGFCNLSDLQFHELVHSCMESLQEPPKPLLEIYSPRNRDSPSTDISLEEFRGNFDEIYPVVGNLNELIINQMGQGSPDPKTEIRPSKNPNLSSANERSSESVDVHIRPSHNDEELLYTIKKVGEKRFKKNGAIDRKYQVTFKEESFKGQRLADLYRPLEDMFKESINEARSGLQDSDLGRVIVHHDKLSNAIYIPLKPLAQLTASDVMDHIQNVLTSHEDLPFDHSFYIDIGTIEIPKGGKGRSVVKLTGKGNDRERKKSLIQIVNDDNMCLARSIVMGFLKIVKVTTTEWHEAIMGLEGMPIEEQVLEVKVCPTWYYKKLLCHDRKSQDCQTDMARALCRRANMSTDVYLTTRDIPPFEEVLNVDILVVSSTVGNRFIRPVPANEENEMNEGPVESTSRKRIYLYHSETDTNDLHFDAISNICGFFGNTKFCQRCLKPYHTRHQCLTTCFVCKRDNCVRKEEEETSCLICFMTCRSFDCFQQHQQKKKRAKESSCQRWWKCVVCKKVMQRSDRKPEDHFCGEWRCNNCKKFVANDHLCYMRAKENKESNSKYIFFDFECTQEDVLQCQEGYRPLRNPDCSSCKDMPVSCGSCDLCTNCEKSWCGRLQHKPNLVVAHKTCPDCINDVDISMHPKCETCGMRCKMCGVRDKKEKCYLRPPCVDTCGFRETVFRGDDTARMFCDWLFREHHKGYTVLAHNMKGYDGYFVLEYLIENSVIPKVIYAGSKIMYMHVERGLNIRMLDSLNFLPMRLANLPSAFGLTEVKKGFFPHYFNTRANQRYVGPYPAAQFYGCDTMNASDRDSFMDWYREKVETREIFDFSKELLEYCKSDVDILRKACLKFREILMTITGKEEVVLGEEGLERVVRGGVDPFNHITIASVCMQVFRSKFLKESWKVKLRSNGNLTEWLPALRMDGEFSINLDGRWISARDMQDHTIESTEFVSSPIAQVPSQGYGPYVGQYSMASIRWLLWVQEDHFRLTGKQMYIRHALNEGEFNLAGTKYLLDGYCAETNTAYEFHGCFWHGCPLCYPQQRRKNKHVRTDQSMDELLALTFKKKKYIESLGMNYVEIWEHDFYKLLARNDSARRFIESLDIQERLNPRESFFGGRTNAVKLHYKVKDGEKIHYLDFCSLYPSVNKYARYPIKEPTIITNNFKDIRSYFGMVKVKVLPPRKLYHPVLPQKINGKLTFALCRTCAEVQRQTTCACRDEDRSFVGVFCTPEIEKALECGYLVQKIYEVYHWEESTQFDLSTGEGGIFGEYINLFLKIKQEASGWPSWVKDEEDAMHYLGQYLEREGIKLDRQNITKNPALRAIAKLLLNSFWGKFGQRLNMPQSTFFHENEADKFFQIVSDPGKELRDFHIVSKNVLQLSWEHKDVNTREDYQTNIFVASFTTCWARLKLYEVLQTLDQRVLYFDTDSVIFVSRPGDAEPQVGSFLGQLTSELKPGEYINEFVSGGPKNYAYRTSSGTEVCKIRGFSLNHANARVLNFRSMIEMAVRPRDMSNDTLSVMNRNKINRLKRKRIIYSRPERKDYKIVYSKRVIQGDTLDTLPYGY